MDRARGNFSLKESQLATMLLAAANISKKSDRGRKLLDWKKQGGNFAETAVTVTLLQATFSTVQLRQY